MANAVATCTDLTILTGQTVSRWVESVLETGDANIIAITAPATLDVGTYTLEVSFDGSTAAGTINDGTADVAVPAAGKHCQYENFAAPYWRIKGPSAAADRTFKLTKAWNAY